MRNWRCIRHRSCRGSILKNSNHSFIVWFILNRHLILVDNYESRGHLMSITRNGINHDHHGNNGATFEEMSKFYLMLLPWLKVIH